MDTKVTLNLITNVMHPDVTASGLTRLVPLHHCKSGDCGQPGPVRGNEAK